MNVYYWLGQYKHPKVIFVFRKAFLQPSYVYKKVEKRHKSLVNNIKISLKNKCIYSSTNKSSAMRKVIKWSNNTYAKSKICIDNEGVISSDPLAVANKFIRFFQPAAQTVIPDRFLILNWFLFLDLPILKLLTSHMN